MVTMCDLGAVALAACVSTAIGCAAPSEPGSGEWTTALVMEVRRAAEPGMQANMRCVDRVTHDDSSYVVVVRYRSAHMLRAHALVVPSADTVHVGDTVSMDMQRCVLRQLAAR